MNNELWLKVQADELGAFEMLYEEQVFLLVNNADRVTGDRELAKDIIQDVFMTLYLKRKELPSDMNVKGYLINAVKYRIINHTRNKQFRNQHATALLFDESIRQVDDLISYDRKEMRARIIGIAAGLPGKCRQAFLLNYVSELSYREVAVEMGISIKTVEKHISKALRIFRRVFR